MSNFLFNERTNIVRPSGLIEASEGMASGICVPVDPDRRGRRPAPEFDRLSEPLLEEEDAQTFTMPPQARTHWI
jgi:hypothetical protein